MSDVGPPKAHQLPNYLTWAILATIFCCTPLGIVSIVFAAQVNGRLASGDYQAAKAASERARRWAWITFGVGLVEKLIELVVLIALLVLLLQQKSVPVAPFGPGP